MTHASVPPEERVVLGITDTLVGTSTSTIIFYSYVYSQGLSNILHGPST